MKITVRLIGALFLVSLLVAFVSTFVQVRGEREDLIRELTVRASVLGENIQELLTEYIRTDTTGKMERYVSGFKARVRLRGLAVFDSLGECTMASSELRALVHMSPVAVHEAIVRDEPVTSIESWPSPVSHLYILPIDVDSVNVGALMLYHDASFIDAQLDEIWKTSFIRLLIQIFLLSVVTMLVLRWSLTNPIAKLVEWMKRQRTGEQTPIESFSRGDILAPLTTEVALLAKSLAHARAVAEEESKLRIGSESLWTSERLNSVVKTLLNGKPLIVVSNREPYVHMHHGAKVDCIIPAGGLITALDPILQACGGLWVAQGSGDADRETSDANGQLAVPPDAPSYTLSRIYLSKEQEEGYYYGFSNEGLWPLCHITHTRPVFELEDWIQYQRVNELFAERVLQTIADEESPLILIQDYHFALLPLLIKSRRPDARVAIFWHIPWPNPEVFGICPWKQELLLGLLGADLVGFHTQFHCNNFLETVDRFLESKINWDLFSAEHGGQVTEVRPFPISIAFNAPESHNGSMLYDGRDKNGLLQKHDISTEYLGVGVDRIDYTKGIVERFQSVKRFLEKHPEYIGRFVFVELGAPSRTHIKRYHDLMAELDELVDRINWSFQTKEWKPILFLKSHHSHDVIGEYYRAADVCMVTSLHDGMNLVAKEFVASRSDGDGVLILSQFAGAAQELRDALIINPYDIEAMSDAIYTSLTMEQAERRERMRLMRTILRERNVFRWAANIITTLAQLRIQKQPLPSAQ
ncbi:MAG TPA: trehalose-6-phosphate synthase [Bacteroidota bacterium]|nr:trehalose-6-phosphate synthase [Bacteroidota bacterium]